MKFTVAPCELAKYWKERQEELRAKLKNIDDKMDELKDKYNVDEVMDIYARELGDSDDVDVEAAVVSVTCNILRKRYNLETAQLIGSCSSDLPRSDSSYYEERLYQQDTGEFFLVGRGGPNTKYGRAYEDGSARGGGRTFSISIADAKDWIEKNQDGSERTGLK